MLDWYAAHARELPWRRPDRIPWGVLVSEVMLQQTPVARVLPVWTAWMGRWPRPGDLAADPVGEAIRAWGRLGYPRRAVRLHQAAAAITQRHDGEVPSEHAALLALPGIGTYTAAAVVSFAFGQRHPVLDTNVRRVLARAVQGSAQAAPSPTAAETRLAVDLLPAVPLAATWSVAVMELGALVCTARSPGCGVCPIRRQCRWHALDHPAPSGPARRGQAWHGTDRQVRGRLMAVLREASGAVRRTELELAVPESTMRDAGQRDRCLDSLVADGLVEPLDGDRLVLPG